MAAKIRRLGINQCLSCCVLFLLFVRGQCSPDLHCIEVKKAYTQKGGNENEVPIQAISGEHLEVCPQGSTCCTKDMESKLKSLSEKEYNTFLDNAFKYAKGTFVSRTRKFDEFFTELLDNAKDDLHEMFVKTYGLLYQQNSYVFTSLFEDLRSYYKGTDLSLLTVLDRFFQTLFRKMFQLLNVSHKFTDNYLDCVTSQMDKLKPFGDVPQKLSSQVKRSFVAARTFVQGLAIGRDVILEVLKILPTDACTKGLMRMTYCPHCRGITQTKPCNNLCLNTMKGCLAYHAELNSPWNEYIEAMKQLAERLEGPFNIEAVVDPIDVKISEAIMILQENSQSVQDQVTLGCGQAQANIRTKRSAAGESSMEKSAPAGQGQGQPAGLPIKPQSDTPAGEKMPIEGIGSSFLEASKELDKQLQSQLFSGGLKNDKTHRNPYDKFSLGKYDRSKESKDVKPTTAAGTSLDRLVKDIKEKVKVAKDFWIQLPYSICNDDEIAAQPQDDKDCWNGADRGRYTSAVQKDGVMNQINNPEVIVNINEANYIIEQQKLQLKIITSKLNNAFNGEEVTWVDTDIVGVYGTGSGDYSGDDGIYDGSGSGDGSGGGSGDGSDRSDDEDYGRKKNKGKNHGIHHHGGHGHTHMNKKPNKGDNNRDLNFVGPEYGIENQNTRRPPSGQGPGSSASTMSVSWTSLSLLLVTLKVIYHIMI